MNTTQEVPVNDHRIARCQHPLLRDALVFRPGGRVAAPLEQKSAVARVRTRRVETVDESSINPVAKALIKVVEVGVAGFMMLCSPI